MQNISINVQAGIIIFITTLSCILIPQPKHSLFTFLQMNRKDKFTLYDDKLLQSKTDFHILMHKIYL